MVRTQLVTIVATLIILVVAGPSRGPYGQSREPEADLHIKLGTREPPLPPGEGGSLFVTAPGEFCTDSTHELQLNLFANMPHYVGPILVPGYGGPILRLLAGPSLCQWEFNGLPAGKYEAQIQDHSDGRIVAIGRGQLSRGGTAVMTLEPAAVEVEGRVTDHGVPMTNDIRLVFTTDGPERDQWKTPLDMNGAYQVKLGTNRRVCMSLERTAPLNVFPLGKCRAFVTGLQRFDIDDVHLPPGVLRVEISPLTDAAFGAFAKIQITKAGDSGPWITGFKLLRGLRGDYFASGYGEYLISLTTLDGKSVMASSRIALSPEQPVGDFILTAPAVR
jgi:hypothetical protein